MHKFLCLISQVVLLVSGQTQIDLLKQSNPLTRQIKSGTVLPTACLAGDVFIKVDAPSGQNVYACTAANTWLYQGGLVSIFSDGVEIGARPIQNFAVGLGIIQAFVDEGTRLNLVTAIDSAVVQTRANAQAGTDTLCLSNSGSATAFTCSFGLRLMNYETGMVVSWIPDQSGTGAATTLAIDGRPAAPVKLSDGITNPASYDLEAGRLYLIWYDGTNFRLIQNTDPISSGLAQTRPNAQAGAALLCESASGTSTAQICSLTPALTAYTRGMVLNWIPNFTAEGVALTLTIDGLSAVPVKLANGTSNPAATDLIAGKLYTIWYDGTNFRLIQESDPVASGIAQTRANAQSGAALLCESASGSDTDYTCLMNPALTAYTKGMVLGWIPDLSALGGAATLAVDGLAPVPVKLADGITNPLVGDLVAGRQYEVWYDGANFRLRQKVESITASVSRPSCVAGLAGRIWYQANADGTKDEVAVCAKNDSNVFDWRLLY